MKRHYEKTYGISPIVLCRPKRIAGKQRFCVVCEGRRHIDLNYASPDNAIKHAENFIRHCYKNFVDFQGNQVTFSFKQI